MYDVAGAVSTSRRAVRKCVFIAYLKPLVRLVPSTNTLILLQLRGAKVPESEFTTLPNGLKFVILL